MKHTLVILSLMFPRPAGGAKLKEEELARTEIQPI
jgi:hypothetical protein